MSKTNVQKKIAIILAYPGKTYEKNYNELNKKI